MPHDNPILSHWQTELQNFSRNLSLLQKRISADAVHDLRVAIKKLRSYFKFYELVAGREHDQHALLKTRDLFSVLGKHRNIEISRNLLIDYAGEEKPSLHSLFVYLQLMQDQISEFARRCIGQYQNDEFPALTAELEQETAQLDNDRLLEITRKWIAGVLENIKHNLKHFEEKSHLVRKDLKDVFYRVRMLDHDLFSKPQVKSIDKILDHLGNIQDHEMFIASLKTFRKAILAKGVEEHSVVRKLEEDAKKKQAALLEKANELTDKLVAEL